MEEVTDGILRKADLPIVKTNKCHQYLDMSSNKASDYPGFLCAGGAGKEESCYVRNKYLEQERQNSLIRFIY